jgi:hypothetical protein
MGHPLHHDGIDELIGGKGLCWPSSRYTLRTGDDGISTQYLAFFTECSRPMVPLEKPMHREGDTEFGTESHGMRSWPGQETADCRRF